MGNGWEGSHRRCGGCGDRKRLGTTPGLCLHTDLRLRPRLLLCTPASTGRLCAGSDGSVCPRPRRLRPGPCGGLFTPSGCLRSGSRCGLPPGLLPPATFEHSFRLWRAPAPARTSIIWLVVWFPAGLWPAGFFCFKPLIIVRSSATSTTTLVRRMSCHVGCLGDR